VNILAFKHQNCGSKFEREQKIMRQILTTLNMKTYVGNGPKKSVMRLSLAREKVCLESLEETEEVANVLKNMLACDENFIFQHDQDEKC